MGPFSALAGLYQPSLNNMISSRLSSSEQGELQGAVGAVTGLALMLGPLPMTYLFKKFTEVEKTSALYLPGAPFLFGAVLSLIALTIFLALTTKADRDARFTADKPS